jgi:transposase
MNTLSARDNDSASDNDSARDNPDGDDLASQQAGEASDDRAQATASGHLQDLPGPMPGRRRRFTSEEKRLFITQAMSPGESMSSVGRRHGLSVSLLFRWRRQLDRDLDQKGITEPSAPRSDARDLRERVRELERLLGRKTLEVELLQQELSRLGHNPGIALQALDNANPGSSAASARR